MPFVRFVNSQRLVELKSSFCFLFFPSAIFLRRGNGERWRGGWFESKYRGANIFSLFSNQFHSALWIYALVDCLSLNSREEFMLFVDNRWFVLKRGRTSFSPPLGDKHERNLRLAAWNEREREGERKRGGGDLYISGFHSVRIKWWSRN